MEHQEEPYRKISSIKEATGFIGVTIGLVDPSLEEVPKLAVAMMILAAMFVTFHVVEKIALTRRCSVTTLFYICLLQSVVMTTILILLVIGRLSVINSGKASPTPELNDVKRVSAPVAEFR